MSPDLIVTFLLASILLSLVPGPDNLFVLTQSALHGWRSGVFITLGLCTGLIVHTTLVALGVAAIFMVSATAFLVLKLAGAGYLLWLAWQSWRAGAGSVRGEQTSVLSMRQLYLRGILMNLSNPKVAIFFLAFLPQFAQVEAALPVSSQLFMFGLLFIVVALLVFSGIALLAGLIARGFQRSERARILLNRATAVLFVGLAARLVLASR